MDAIKRAGVVPGAKNKTRRRRNMPGKDGTGPMGAEQIAGRGFGNVFCYGAGRGLLLRRGFCGRGNISSSLQNPADQAQEPTKQVLEEQVSYLESLLKDAKANLERISNGGKA